MNSLTDLIPSLNDLVEGRPLVYRYFDEHKEKTYLLTDPGKASDEALNLIVGCGSNAQLLISPELFSQAENHGLVQGSAAACSCSFTARGIRQLSEEMAEGRFHEAHGDEYLIVRPFPGEDIIGNPSMEASLVEFLAGMDFPCQQLLITPLHTIEGDELVGDQLNEFITHHSLSSFSSGTITNSRAYNSRLLEMTGKVEVTLVSGTFQLYSFYSIIDQRYHWAFVKGDISSSSTEKTPLVRIESECLTGHVFGSLLCDCGNQLKKGLQMVQESGCGALVYLRQEGRGIGLVKKLRAYKLQQQDKMDTVDANLAQGLPEDARDYVIGVQILKFLGIEKVRLLTNNPAKVKGVEQYGLTVQERVSHIIPPSHHNVHYLSTKKKRMGHLL